MKNKKIIIAIAAIIILIVGILAYFLIIKNSSSNLDINMSNWKYDETNNVYYQIGVEYATKIETKDYETLGIYVPGEYFDCSKNSDDTYKCEINKKGTKSDYNYETAPIIFPVDTPGYSAQKSPTEYNYNSIKDYIEAGYVYVIAGMRGRSSMMGTSDSAESYSGGAPYGLTDLKAAVRYIRYNDDVLTGNTDRIFSYGMSGGGAQSALLGATGDSELYTPYLKSIGAAMKDKKGNTISDAIAGSMDWCPITSLDIADEAYEWNMGQYFDTDSRSNDKFTSELSDDLAIEFAKFINKLELKDEDGNVLKLEESSDGIYNNGTYYEYIKKEIETSLNNFLSDTTFPYTSTGSKIQVGNTAESGNFNGGDFGGNIRNGEKPSGDKEFKDMDGQSGNGTKDFKQGNFGNGTIGNNNSNNSGTTYQTAQDYIDSLNKNGEWIKYNSKTNTATITSIKDFVINSKNATKTVGAFDSVDASQGENNVFGNGQNESKHFDSIEAKLLKDNEDKYSKYSDWDSTYIKSYESDLSYKDKLGTDMQTRVNMYNPMYYLSSYYDGYNKSTIAKYWRIRTGINQTDTALTTEINLKLALENNKNVESVDFATVWGQVHTTAERTGTSTENFINWVNECLK